MTKDEYLNMTDEQKFKYLNSQAVLGKSFGVILSEIGLTKEALAKEGIYWVGNKFVRKSPAK